MMKDGGSRVTASVETRPSASDRRGGHLRLHAFAGAPAVKCNGWYKSNAEMMMRMQLWRHGNRGANVHALDVHIHGAALVLR